MMKYLVEEPKRRRFTQDQISKHVKVFRELPQDVDNRIANVHLRNEILKANKRYQMEIEKKRAQSALQTLPVNQQANLRHHLASINADLLALTRKGSPVP
jgi:hypothetical protein